LLLLGDRDGRYSRKETIEHHQGFVLKQIQELGLF